MDQLVFIEDNEPKTDSITVSHVFGKEHKNVLRDIRDLGCSAEFARLNFEHTPYRHPQNGLTYSKVVMTERGFTLLVMGYTGPRAMEFKEQYIAEFDKMRKQLSRPKTQLEVLQSAIAQLVEQERRMAAIERRQDGLAEIIGLHPIEWRKKTTRLLNKIAQKRGGHDGYQEVRSESYQLLEERAACNLTKRLTNRKQKMALEGAQKSKVDRVNKMDVIADDARLTEIYLAVVKEMAIRYQVVLDEAVELSAQR